MLSEPGTSSPPPPPSFVIAGEPPFLGGFLFLFFLFFVALGRRVPALVAGTHAPPERGRLCKEVVTPIEHPFTDCLNFATCESVFDVLHF